MVESWVGKLSLGRVQVEGLATSRETSDVGTFASPGQEGAHRLAC